MNAEGSSPYTQQPAIVPHRESDMSSPYSPRAGAKLFYISQYSDRLWGPPSLLYNVLGVRRQGRDADHSPTFSADGRNGKTIPLLHRTSSWGKT
jgi:hypothetical protein